MVLNCSEWTTADLPLDGSPTTLDNFTSTLTVTSTSVAYQAINPLRGTILLTTEEYEELDGEELYAIMYMEDDATAYGRARGVVRSHAQASCIGGLVFEYSDEWWKGGNDTYHLDCYDDNASFQSPCGSSSDGFGPDGRLNEEFFGLYNMSVESEAPYRITMTARPAVAALQELWGITSAGTATASRRAFLQTTDDIFAAVFPNSVWDLLSDAEGLVLLGILTFLIVLGTTLPLLWSMLQSPKPERVGPQPITLTYRLSDGDMRRSRSAILDNKGEVPEHEVPTVSMTITHRNLHGLGPVELLRSDADSDVASTVTSRYVELRQ